MGPADSGAPRGSRLFFALWPDDAVRAALYRTAQALHGDCGGRMVKRDKLHQTLVFLGDVAPERMCSIAKLARSLCLPAFTLEFGVTGYWRHNRIVWAAPRMTPEPLRAVVAALEHGLGAQGFATGLRPYASHVTLIRDARAPAALPALEFDWPVRAFALVESVSGDRGAQYRVRESWALEPVMDFIEHDERAGRAQC